MNKKGRNPDLRPRKRPIHRTRPGVYLSLAHRRTLRWGWFLVHSSQAPGGALLEMRGRSDCLSPAHRISTGFSTKPGAFLCQQSGDGVGWVEVIDTCRLPPMKGTCLITMTATHNRTDSSCLLPKSNLGLLGVPTAFMLNDRRPAVKREEVHSSHRYKVNTKSIGAIPQQL